MNIRVEGKQKRALITRQKVLEAYQGLAKVKKFDEISIAEIAAVAGVGKGTVLAHFSEKIALPAAAFADALDEVTLGIAHSSKENFDITDAVLPLLNFIFTDDVYARIMLWEGHDVCEAIIGPSEKRLFEALSAYMPHDAQMSAETQFDILRALLVNAVVMRRTCMSVEEIGHQFKKLMTATLGAR